MPNMTVRGSQPSTLQKYGMLLMGLFLVILAGGRFVTPAAAFLAPVFLLMFTRNTSCRSGTVILYVLLFLSLLVRLLGFVPAPKAVYLCIVACLALVETLPFLLDRLMFQKLPAAVVPFVLPSAMVSLSFVVSAVLPLGTLASSAYTQMGNLELMQLSAVTGIHGITFVVLWFASTMASLWGSGFAWRKCRRQFLPLSICLMLIFVSGGFRNIFEEAESNTVRIAGVTGNQVDLQQSLRVLGVDNITGHFVATDQIVALFTSYHDSLFERSAKEAAAGAKIIAWGEGDGVVFEADVAGLLAKAAQFSKRHNAYLVTALLVVPEDSDALRENKLIVFGPDGQQLAEYIKNRHLPGGPHVQGDGELGIFDTVYGKVALSVGYDLDSPRLMRQAGKSKVDIIIAPSLDWKTISPHHSHMAVFRGVENGASVFRIANKGKSMISDSHGRVLAQVDHFRTSPHTIVGEIPVEGATTFYARVGDWFSWLSLLLCGGLLYRVFGSGWRAKRRMR